MLHIHCEKSGTAHTIEKQLRFNYDQVFFKSQEKAAIKMMTIVIGLFLLCSGILLRCSFLLIFSDDKPCDDLQYKVPLLVLNSAVNPLAYAIFKRDIKKEFKRLIYFVILKRRN
ncbi:G-protein coupled receptor [Desmophyllum pertusum]|uniref:G-protein coupled receptor n=1 Tax=Desmophyllum pertusum TaxID=174260 RepID=A0A9X0CKY2_9CNID|nr:G-protein coupled receptor [Desmophyllum pertusum]